MFPLEAEHGPNGDGVTRFRYTAYAQEITFGAGSLAAIGDAVAGFGWERLVLCASGSGRRAGHVAAVEAALGARVVAVYDRVQPHVPEDQVAAAVALAGEHDCDAVIGLGGGSAIGTAKAVAAALEERRTGHPARAAAPTDQPLVPVVAIPTTYAGSEMTPTFGVTRQSDGLPRKVTVTDAKIAPKLVLYDPELTLDLPPPLTAGTGINALAHCVEAVYSTTRHPLSTAAALAGARLIAGALPTCIATPHDLAARTDLLMGSHLAANALASVSMALHHGLCHVLGGSAGVPHGVANAIVLPHAMRFSLEATAAHLALLGGALGVRDNDRDIATADATIAAVAELIAQLGLPRRLRDVNVREGEFPLLVELALQSRAVQSNPKPVTGADVEGLLRDMW